MTYIVMDLEWNGAYTQKAKGYFNEIIEIGAVKLDEHMQQVGQFHAVMKPVVSRILSSVVKSLTSITEEELNVGIPFTQAVSQFRKWIGTKDAVILTWSTTDLLVLMENCRYFYNSERIPFMPRYADLQEYCQLRLGVGMAQQLGLSKACEQLEIGEEDLDLHRALDDSVLSARVLSKIYEPESFQQKVHIADDAFYERITFKSMIISNIDNPLIERKELRFTCEVCGRGLRRINEWRFHSRAFNADFQCKSCQKDFAARVQFKQKYEGVEVKRKLTEKVKPEEDPKEEMNTDTGGIDA